jgi:uncharacterized membrane protein YeaQ/YmgE (transglycosylase-associated protein family)
VEQNYWLSWVIVGAIAGWLASLAQRSPLGLVGDIIVGIVGALLGGFLAMSLGLAPATSLVAIFAAFIGAVVLTGVLRLMLR